MNKSIEVYTPAVLTHSSEATPARLDYDDFTKHRVEFDWMAELSSTKLFGQLKSKTGNQAGMWVCDDLEKRRLVFLPEDCIHRHDPELKELYEKAMAVQENDRYAPDRNDLILGFPKDSTNPRDEQTKTPIRAWWVRKPNASAQFINLSGSQQEIDDQAGKRR